MLQDSVGLIELVFLGSIALSVTVIIVAIRWLRDLKKMKRGDYGK
jgi:hypothetical protein